MSEERVLLRVMRWSRVALNSRTYESGETFTVPAAAVARWLSRHPVELVDEQHSESAQRSRENTFGDY
ncbi:hypothetical protein ABZS81_16640 [Streptomyces sp. NPDC005318]|uniref:hypothetical protein n=1 Tax=Streptomyces sp. NPDC005318 TaxID=3157031 RepID=UPI0033AF13A4